MRNQYRRAQSLHGVLAVHIVRLVVGGRAGSSRILVVNSQGLSLRDDQGGEVGCAWGNIRQFEVEYLEMGKAAIRVVGAESDLFEFMPLHNDGVRPCAPHDLNTLKSQLEVWLRAYNSTT